MMTKLGICSLLAGFFTGILTGISKFMESQNFWVDLTLSKMLGENRSESIVGLTEIAMIQNSLDYIIYELPFFLFLIGVGVIFLIIGMFVKSH